MDFNPILSEIQGHFAAMSPEAQGAVKMAGMTPPPDPTITAPGKISPGMLLPHPDAGPPPAPIGMESQTPPLTMPSATPQLVTGPKRGQAMMTTGEHVPMGTTMGDTAERTRLLDQGPPVDNIYHNITSSDFGQNHPFLGKLLGGAAEVGGKIGDTLANAAPGIGREIPGTTANHNMLLGQANAHLGQDIGNAQKEATTASENATAQHTNAETPEVAPDAASKRALEGAQAGEVAGANATKESIADKNIEGRESIAQTGAASREQIAQTGADSRESIAHTAAEAKKSAMDAQDRTREAVARIRGTGAGGKGANGQPTNNSKARGEMSETMLAQAPGILQEIDALNSKIGPGAGRWNNFWVKKGGINDPDYAGLDQDLGLYASALAVAHFGSRGGGAHFIEAMKKDFGQAQSPEDLKARILHADKWLEGYAEEGKGEKPGATPQDNDPSDPLGVRPKKTP